MDYKLNEVQQLVSDFLAKYRCATAVQLSQFVYGQYITVSNEKYVYAQLKKLEAHGLITRFKPSADISKHAVYYLNEDGLEWYQWLNNIIVGDLGEGWSEGNGKMGYFPFTTYSPPLKQLKHHLMLIDSFLILHCNRITHRNNLHAKRVVKLTGSRPSILKPDGEMIINNERYAIEIDMGTESHRQLEMKFRNYFEYEAEYREHCRFFEKVDGKYDLENIVFIVQDAPAGHLQRRWENVLAAYHKSMRGLHDKFRLYFVPMSQFNHFVHLEQSKIEFSLDQQRFLQEWRLYRFKEDLSTLHIEKLLMREFSPEEIYRTMTFHLFSTPYSNSHAYALKEMNDAYEWWIDPSSTEIYLPDLSRYDTDPTISKIYEEANSIALSLKNSIHSNQTSTDALRIKNNKLNERMASENLI